MTREDPVSPHPYVACPRGGCPLPANHLAWEELETLQGSTLAASPADGAGVDPLYRERAALVAALIRVGGYPADVVMAPDTEGWFIVYAETPAGQVSWHVSPDDMDLFSEWPVAFGTRPSPWDGHTTEEKYRRVAALEGPTQTRPYASVAPDRRLGRVTEHVWLPNTTLAVLRSGEAVVDRLADKLHKTFCDRSCPGNGELHIKESVWKRDAVRLLAALEGASDGSITVKENT